jgi:hypothetical protein
MRLHQQAPTLACPTCGSATLHLASAAVYTSALGPTVTLAMRCALQDCGATHTLELANRHGICRPAWLGSTTTGPQHTPALAALPLPADATTGALAPTHGAAVERVAAAGASPTSSIAADPVATAAAAATGNLGPRVAGPGWRPQWGDPSNPPGQSSAWRPWENDQPQCLCDHCGVRFAMGERIYWRASRGDFAGASLHLDCYRQLTLPAPDAAAPF